MRTYVNCPRDGIFFIHALDEHSGATCPTCEKHLTLSAAELKRIKAVLGTSPELPFGACPDCGGDHHESEHMAPPKLCEACNQPMPIGTRDTRRFHVGCCPSRNGATANAGMGG